MHFRIRCGSFCISMPYQLFRGDVEEVLYFIFHLTCFRSQMLSRLLLRRLNPKTDPFCLHSEEEIPVNTSIPLVVFYELSRNPSFYYATLARNIKNRNAYITQSDASIFRNYSWLPDSSSGYEFPSV